MLWLFTGIQASEVVSIMDDLQFNVLFNSISVISGQWEGDNERFVQWNPVYYRDGSSNKLQICFILN